jgi:hypothetical protein
VLVTDVYWKLFFEVFFLLPYSRLFVFWRTRLIKTLACYIDGPDVAYLRRRIVHDAVIFET